jgi:6-pyruvoyltetrahydropterin/6-carboxytetrahydropterin synthase
MYRIEKIFEFDAAHRLDGLPDAHPCSRMHGHNYTVKIILEKSTLDHIGFVRDYRELDEFKAWLDNVFDHRIVNDRLIGVNSTAENIARAIYQYAATLYPEIAAVGVSETHKTWAYYSPQNVTLDVLETAIDSLPEPHKTNFRIAMGMGTDSDD